MYGLGRFGVHVATDSQITGEIHSEPGFNRFEVSGMCCTFSLDDWVLEERCEHKS